MPIYVSNFMSRTFNVRKIIGPTIIVSVVLLFDFFGQKANRQIAKARKSFILERAKSIIANEIKQLK
jgi:hypothetical protein